MHIVAMHSLAKDKEVLAGRLAAALGVTTYEALARLRAPGNGPLTVGVFAEKERAEQRAELLRTAGFQTALLTNDEIETERHARAVRQFSLGDHELCVTTDKGDSLGVPFQNIRLILRGTMIVRDVSTETVTKRSVSPGRAVLSGGLALTKTTKEVREVTRDERQGFVNLYTADGSILAFREKSLLYDSLGPALKASQAANFSHLVSELRRRCPQAPYDDRLLSRAGQIALLGPSLTPEDHLVVATALLAKVLQAESSERFPATSA
jgi:superfamily II DNA/RNA helicase